MPRLRFKHRHATRAVARLLAGAVALGPAAAAADTVQADPKVAAEAGYAPVAELSHEVIVEPRARGRAWLRYRMALNNASAVPRDVVVTWGLPAGARIEGLSILREGRWVPGVPVRDLDTRTARDVGSFFVRTVEVGAVSAGELVAFQIPPETTVQVEVTVRAATTLRAGRYEIRLPERGKPSPGVARRRRILVRGVDRFWVDETPSGTSPVLEVEANRENVVAWSAADRGFSGLRVEARATPDGFGGSSLDVVLEVGRGRLRSFDRVVVLVDRSVSTDPTLPDKAIRALGVLFEAMPPSVALAGAVFARHVTPLEAPRGARVGDYHALRDRWRSQILAHGRAPGTDVYGALARALDEAARAGARRPLVLLVTDGMVPQAPPPAGLARRLRRADVLLLVDVPAEYEPPGPRHPVVAFADAVSGRLAPVPLAAIDAHNAAAVLAAPQVARLRSVRARGVRFADPLPPFVPSGARVVAHGVRASGRPRRVEVTASLGGTTVRRTVPVRVRAPAPAAFGVHLYAVERDAVRDGFALPVWYRDRLRRAALDEVRRAGRGGDGLRGLLTQDIIRSYLRIRVLPRVRVCHRHAVARARDQAGRAVLRFEIARGEVMGVALEDVELVHDDPALTACLVDAGWALDVPAARRDDTVYHVRYPVRLLPAAAGPAVTREDEATLRSLLGDAPRHEARRRAPAADPLAPGPLPR